LEEVVSDVQAIGRVALLLEQRDMLLGEMRALQNKVAGIDMALAILDADAPESPSHD
jgi:hypothetical protein